MKSYQLLSEASTPARPPAAACHAALLFGVMTLAACASDHGENEEHRSLDVPVEFAGFAAKLTPLERAEFVRFTALVSCGQLSCSLDDMAFADREGVVEYFRDHVLHEREKGLVVAESQKFKTTATVCWTADSNATAAQRAAVIADVETTWKRYANIDFDWYSSGTTPRTCDETQAPAYDIKIWQDSSQTRGCSYVGKNAEVGIECDNAVSHNYANMLLEAGKPGARDSYGAVHEFGHAIGIYHEQDRDDAPPCTKKRDPEMRGSRHVGPYDPESIMNYCATNQNGDISYGDVLSATFLYSARGMNATFSGTSWIPSDLTYRVVLPNGTSATMRQTGVTTSPTTLTWGATQIGSAVSVTAADSSLRCGLRSVAPRLRTEASATLFDSGAVFPAQCYSPAMLAAGVL